MFELKKIGLDIPPPPKKEEIPQLPPGAALKRGTFQTASARARKNKEKDKIISVPVARPPSPESPIRISPIRGLPTQPDSPNYSESEISMMSMSMSTVNDTPIMNRSSMSTVIEAERPRLSSIDLDTRPLGTRNNGSRRDQYHEHRRSDGVEMSDVGYNTMPSQLSYHSETVLIKRDGMAQHTQIAQRRSKPAKTTSTFRPINGDIDALNQSAPQPVGSPVWRTRPEVDSSYQVSFTFV
jgi:hypothetical protein